MQAAEALGIDVEQVSPAVSDTQSIGFALPSVGSRTTYGTGAVVCQVAEEVLQQMAERAALVWETDADQVSVAAGVFTNKADPKQTMTFREVAAKTFETGEPISVHKTSTPDSFIPGIAVHLVDVEVDPDTGKVDILRYTTFQDVGKAVHPDYVEGQMQGAAVQGIRDGVERRVFLRRRGTPQKRKSTRLPDADQPGYSMIETVILESPNPSHPFGVRGCGEIAIAPPPAAIANAIHDAVGIRINSMPMAPHKVCAAIQEKRAQA